MPKRSLRSLAQLDRKDAELHFAEGILWQKGASGIVRDSYVERH